MRSNKMASIVCILVLIVAFGSQVVLAEEAISGARLPESYGFVLKGPLPDPDFTPEDDDPDVGVPHAICLPFTPCIPASFVDEEWVDKGAKLEFNNRMGVYQDTPTVQLWAGVNDSGEIDLLTEVRGRIVMDSGAAGAGVSTFAVSAGFVAQPENLLLEVFDVAHPAAGATPLAFSYGDDGFDADGYNLATVDVTGSPTLIKSFRVSSPVGDFFGVRRFYVTPPEVLAPLDETNGDPCHVPIDGCVHLPPAGCSYLTPAAVHAVLDDNNLPISGTIVFSAIHLDYLCSVDPTSRYCGLNHMDCDDLAAGMVQGAAGQHGDSDLKGPTGDTETFDSKLVLRLQGTGDLAGLDRTITLDAPVITETGPRNPADPSQDFATEMRSIQASLPPGDPDFAMLQVVAGADNGLPVSPGHTTLTEVSPGIFEVVSDFDINFEVTLEGAPGGALDGVPETTIPLEAIVEVPDAELFSDGFESGDTSLWSATVGTR